MKKNSYLMLLVFLCIGLSLNAQHLTDNPANYHPTAPLHQVQGGLPVSSPSIFEQIDSTITTVLCDSGTVTLVGTGIISSSWSTDSLGANVITANDTLTSGLLTSDTSFYHTSISDSTIGSPTLAPQSGTYGSSVRGYYFVAPVDMVITGFWVPTDASTGVQHVEILRFANAPPVYPSTTSSFTSLGSWRSYNALDTIPANLQIYAGDTLGIYGNRADLNSYGPNTDIVIAGVTTPIYRSGMQIPISGNPMQDVFSQVGSSSISRVEFFYVANPDTVVTQHNVSVGQSYTTNQAFTACNGDSVTYNGITYSSDTVLVENLNSVLGCDSMVTTTITIDSALVGNFTATICNGDSMLVNGTTYNAANPTGTEVFTAANGCDSTVSVNINVLPILTGSMTGTICTGDSMVINGTTYSATNSSGTEVLTSFDGCDSTVSINLNVIPTLTGSFTSTICTGDSVFVNGMLYDAANSTGTEVFTSVDGCDSTVTVNLNVLPVATGSYSDTICTGDTVIINGTIYDAANPTGTEVFTAANGCDSTVSVSLGIQSIDVSTSITGFTITANQAGATYQWVDCNNANAPIAGETSSTYMATGNGDYAVMITLGACTEMSNCVNVTGVNTTKIESDLNCSIYPNPTTGQFTVALDVITTPTTIRVFDVLGQLVLTQEVQENKTQINLNNYSNGTYFIEVNNQKSVSVNKLILNK